MEELLVDGDVRRRVLLRRVGVDFEAPSDEKWLVVTRGLDVDFDEKITVERETGLETILCEQTIELLTCREFGGGR